MAVDVEENLDIEISSRTANGLTKAEPVDNQRRALGAFKKVAMSPSPHVADRAHPMNRGGRHGAEWTLFVRNGAKLW
jgi:hypothetical protein